MRTVELILLALLGTNVLFLILSMIKDTRRFRNCLLFFSALLLADLWLIIHFYGTNTGNGIVLATVIIILIFVLIIPVFLIFNGFVMIRKEGFHLSNLLSLLFGLTILAGEVFYIYAFHNITQENYTAVHIAMLGFGHLVFYSSVIFLAFMFYSFLMRIIPRGVDFDYVIVLGAGLINGNQVSKLLADRLDKAHKVYDTAMTSCKIICSGGQGSDETVSEAAAMKEYLIRRAVPANDIILEDKSTTTMENLVNSKAIIKERGGRQITAIVTSNYHVMRADIYAGRIHLPATGIAAHTAFYYWPSALIREYIALIKHYLHTYLTWLIVTGALLFYLLLR